MWVQVAGKSFVASFMPFSPNNVVRFDGHFMRKSDFLWENEIKSDKYLRFINVPKKKSKFIDTQSINVNISHILFVRVHSLACKIFLCYQDKLILWHQHMMMLYYDKKNVHVFNPLVWETFFRWNNFPTLFTTKPQAFNWLPIYLLYRKSVGYRYLILVVVICCEINENE